ncbi:MAG TPA: hypothetical protein VEI97_06350 [bacterium]|nr:hypothetical protein [bacterium]
MATLATNRTTRYIPILISATERFDILLYNGIFSQNAEACDWWGQIDTTTPADSFEPNSDR